MAPFCKNPADPRGLMSKLNDGGVLSRFTKLRRSLARELVPQRDHRGLARPHGLGPAVRVTGGRHEALVHGYAEYARKSGT